MRSKEEIAELVSRHLAEQATNGLRFKVNPNQVMFGDNWYRVPVQPSYIPKKLFALYEVLVEAMESISDQENLNVIIMADEPFTDEDVAEKPLVAASA
jgi:hypothetical protein